MAEATTLQGSTPLALAAATGTTGAMADTATAGATKGTKAMVGTGDNSSRAATTSSSRGAQPMTGTTGSTAILRRSWTCPSSLRFP